MTQALAVPPARDTSAAPALIARGVRKEYPGTQALRWEPSDALTVTGGEIHALVGENGAGKSTLLAVIAGLIEAGAGALRLDGEDYAPHSVAAARRHGVEIVMQEPGLVGALTVTENFFLGRDHVDTTGGVVHPTRGPEIARDALAGVAPHISPRALAGSLALEDQKLVELARAVHFAPRLLLVDEMSACLSRTGLQRLFDVLREQRDSGVAVMYISHYLEEVRELCDRVTVLKDGQLVATLPVADVDEARLTTLMVGRATVEHLYRADSAARTGGAPLLEVQGLTRQGAYRDVSFAVHRGEILGIGGLVGCGADPLARTLFGALAPDAGAMSLGGRPYAPRRPRDAIRRRIAYVPPDRDREGLLLRLSISSNVTLAVLPRLSRAGLYVGRREPRVVRRFVDDLAIRCRGVADVPLNLSGGNRQKVVLAKWLLSEADVFVLHNPTRGIDVGAKAELYALMQRLAESGAAVVLLSDELPELIGMSDRILILRRGAVSHRVTRDEQPTEEQLITHMV
jgi:ABC-type sugar transport system ATPase subunit